MRRRAAPTALDAPAGNKRAVGSMVPAIAGAAMTLVASLWSPNPVLAQHQEIIFPGSMAVSGFPGTYIPHVEQGLRPGTEAVDETFIDPEGASLRIFDVSALGGPPAGQLVNTPPPFEVPAGLVGEVFGLAYDDGLPTPGAVPNLYAAATSLFGVQIVTPDADGDGRPERQRRGTAGATFMEGQFAEERGGSPGAIWKIDGITGAVSLFATIGANSGPGLADIAFDKANRQFFASDLDTGLIHRIDAKGVLVDTFDHGVSGRQARGLTPVADDGAVMDIESDAFDSEDPATWGYTQDERRVWGVQVHGGRVYYSVGEKAQIWSVGLTRDGAFSGDPRWELTVAAGQDLAVTDIAFDTRGFMYLAQRGKVENRYDYSRFAESGKGVVVRYWRESPNDGTTESTWVEAPQEYAVGFPEGYRQTTGGLDLHYGYDADGVLDTNACADRLVTTGDRLRDNPVLAGRLALGGPLSVHGVQVTSTLLVKPRNAPPFGSWFAEFDGGFEDPEVEGHVGDVEVWRPCAGRAGWYEPMPGGFGPAFYPPDFPPPGELPPCIEVEDVDYWCTQAGLQADLYLRDVAGIGGDTIRADAATPGISITPLQQTRPAGAPFTLGITGYLPGVSVHVGLCFYRRSEADKNGYYPCCKVTVPLETPAIACEP